jgi:phosphate uptake regulator
VHARKVLEMGGGTLLVSLPKGWTRKNGIRKGSTVAVEELSPTKLIVRPLGEGPETHGEVSVEYPREDLTHVVNDITGAYLLGYDSIHVIGRKVIAREDRERLKATIRRLIGLEIMDENSKQISLQFLLEPTALDPEKIARRMSSILEGMMKDTAEGVTSADSRLLALVSERDDEIDRLYFLLVRTVRTATIHPDVAERYGLEPVDVLDYRVLASFLESTGDAMAELSKKLSISRLDRRAARELGSCMLRLAEMEGLATQSFFNRKTGRSRGLYLQVDSMSKEVSGMVGMIASLSESSGTPAVEIVGAVERVSRLLVDISDLAVPTRSIGRSS